MKYTNMKEYVYFFEKVHQPVCKIFIEKMNSSTTQGLFGPSYSSISLTLA
jgi:hypothetical protein